MGQTACLGQTVPDQPHSGARSARLQDRYHLQKVRLGSGSFGTVWRGVDRESGEVVAVKQIGKRRAASSGSSRQDVEREIHLLQVATHENITRFHALFEDSEHIYLILEYCDGGDFADKIKERREAMGEPEAADWVLQMCSAVAAMHCRSICHRDVKPENFMVSGGNRLKLADFGLATVLFDGRRLTDKVGTLAFMAPEQHLLPGSSSGYSFPVDVWALGVSMHMVVCGGQHPFVDEKGVLQTATLLRGDVSFGQKFFLGIAVGSSVQLSGASMELCRRMIEVQPSRRITANIALRNPWFGAAAPAPPTPHSGDLPHCRNDLAGAVSSSEFGPPDLRRSATAPVRSLDAGPGVDSHVGTRDFCRMNCGRLAARGFTSKGRPFDTCCRGCALGRGHDGRCTAR
jgi:serine/threonine protein kinase